MYKLLLPYALLQLCYLWQIYLCLLTPNCIEKLLPEHDFFKILYGLRATAWISIAKISYCGLWTMSVNINFRVIFSWLFEAFRYKLSLNILLHLSPPQFIIMYFVVLASKNCCRFFLLYTVRASMAVSMNILGHHNLFCFNRSPKTCNKHTHQLYLFPLDPCQVDMFLSPWLLISLW